jgi:hypothetical protein
MLRDTQKIRKTETRLSTCSGCSGRFGAPDNGATKTTARSTRMVSNDPIKDYMRRHACGFPEALEALAAQLDPRPPPTTSDAPCRRWAGPGRQWNCLRRWKPGAPTRCSRRHDRPHRLGSGPPAFSGSRVTTRVTSCNTARDHKFLPGTRRSRRTGVFPGGEYPAGSTGTEL